MSSSSPLYAGFDLGTSNSAAAVFDGEQLTVVRNAAGSSLTPSVVRIDSRGRETVGARARKHLERDAANTRAEFKRLMGTDRKLEFPDAGLELSPEQLAAKVLAAMRQDVFDQTGISPTVGVISVPALFELPQSLATSRAAELAGFERVELIQEPIASALAAGWDGDHDAGAWLVFDLGGGTFDVSLLETREGLLRVVGHDGDNFLGGRDFDRAVVDWLVGQLRELSGVELSQDDPEHSEALRRLRVSAEEAKIELSRAQSTEIEIDGLKVGEDTIEEALTLDRATLERVCRPVVERTVAVCRRLLADKGMDPSQIGRMVLVGGPTAMPLVRQVVEDGLGISVVKGVDPMTLVAQGAALYAATSGLDARAAGAEETGSAGGRRLWLQYPAVSSDTSPYVVGRVVEGDEPAPALVELARTDGEFSVKADVGEDSSFMASVELLPRRSSTFTLRGFDPDGAEVAVRPSSISIVHGLTISDPPLSRTVGVALAANTVHVYFERGTPLPARRTFTHRIVESVSAGSSAGIIKVPLVQGEFEQAHLCRLVGTVEITGDKLKQSVVAGSPVEVTIEIDRGGRLSAHARVVEADQVFDQVAHLVVPSPEPEALEHSEAELRARLSELRSFAFRNGQTSIVKKLDPIDMQLSELSSDISLARGGDADAGQKASRTVTDVDAALEALELDRQWPDLDMRARELQAWAASAVGEHGTDHEKRLLDETLGAIQKAREERDVKELGRQMRLARRLANTAYLRDPSSWELMFEDAAADAHEASDLPAAMKLVERGRSAMARNDVPALKSATRGLWALLPPDARARQKGFGSGIK
ncbi:MAG: Hsp70 family protein [Deltaproteobacteria bacterium]|nr:Hsp70 family protein [Deltaproteobacteria bacterium]